MRGREGERGRRGEGEKMRRWESNGLLVVLQAKLL